MADGDVGFGRLEVLSGPTGRRRWPDEVKARIVAESFLPGARVGEDRSDRLDIVPAQLRVLVTIRPRFACRKGRAGVVQAPPPPRLIEGGLPTEAFLAWLVVSKYADALPLYRIAQLYAIEAEIRGRPAEERRAVRQARSAPLAASLHACPRGRPAARR